MFQKNSDGAQSSKIIIMVTIILFLEFFKIHDNAIDIIDIAIERTVPYNPTYRIAGNAKLVPFARTIRYGIETKYNIIQMVTVEHFLNGYLNMFNGRKEETFKSSTFDLCGNR
jgi:hypothetical protein